MTDARASKEAPLTLMGQADLLDCLLNRCVVRDGSTAKETWMMLAAKDVADLRALEARLRRMARHEAQIKNLVMRG